MDKHGESPKSRSIYTWDYTKILPIYADDISRPEKVPIMPIFPIPMPVMVTLAGNLFGIAFCGI